MYIQDIITRYLLYPGFYQRVSDTFSRRLGIDDLPIPFFFHNKAIVLKNQTISPTQELRRIQGCFFVFFGDQNSQKNPDQDQYHIEGRKTACAECQIIYA